MKSSLFACKVSHERLEVADNAFQYPLNLFCFDIDDFKKCHNKLWLFGHNSANVFSVYDSDYLAEGKESIKEKLFTLLVENGYQKEVKQIKKIRLITSPRYFGYIFNPVSFYFCLDSRSSLVLFVAEINNTFGDKHVYMVNDFETSMATKKAVRTKNFHVSPFHRMEGEYHFEISELSKTFSIKIDIARKDKKIFTSELQGREIKLSNSSLIRWLCLSPIRPWLTMPRILWQAFRLYYLKKVNVITRPNPITKDTIRHRKPSWSERMQMKIVFLFLRRIAVGTLSIELPDGQLQTFRGKKQAQQTAQIKVNNFNFFRKILFGSDIGFGESFEDNDWESNDVVGLLRLLSDNRDELNPRILPTNLLSRLFDRLLHSSRSNTKQGSKKNIRAHYDLSNDFFKLFLDKSMTYSSGIFQDSESSLYDAQLKKLGRIIDSGQISSEDHVLEIGCGWGSCALEIARTTGARVTAVTISKEQYLYAKKRVKESGFENQIEVLLQDYRELKGQYDCVVSIEMIEAVGYENLPEFFATCQRLLKKEGLLVLQAITMAESHIKEYRNSCDWIQKHIFPGCYVPALSDLVKAASANYLSLGDSKSIGIHYAETLRRWREEFNTKKSEVLKLGFDQDFIRRWNFYLMYCEAGFLNKDINTYQLVFYPRENMSYGNPLVSANAAMAKTANLYSVCGNGSRT